MLFLFQFYSKFGRTMPEGLGRGRDWNVDLIPKFLMANGELLFLLGLKRVFVDNIEKNKKGFFL